ncbi:hypothetical protein FS764_18925 [Agrobacterium vitis]|uniref:hypothetical protein n=1 Tax=Agrobacterium vitis TaxID=373 RepID=UPI001F20221F|nr:hypothetical protein [Agrobacterium vitis]MCF1468980.1 hypothetical protein [Agrobacterium vitis]
MKRSLWIAFLVAPLWAPLCFFGYSVISAPADPILAEMSTAEIVATCLVVAVPTAYIAMFVVGLPVHLIPSKQGLRRAVHYAVSGFCTGVVLRCIGLATTLFSFARQNNRGAGIVGKELSDAFFHEPLRSLAPGLVGLFIAVIFWSIPRPESAQNSSVPKT